MLRLSCLESLDSDATSNNSTPLECWDSQGKSPPRGGEGFRKTLRHDECALINICWHSRHERHRRVVVGVLVYICEVRLGVVPTVEANWGVAASRRLPAFPICLAWPKEKPPAVGHNPTCRAGTGLKHMCNRNKKEKDEQPKWKEKDMLRNKNSCKGGSAALYNAKPTNAGHNSALTLVYAWKKEFMVSDSVRCCPLLLWIETLKGLAAQNVPLQC